MFSRKYEEQTDAENRIALGNILALFLDCKYLLEIVEPDFVIEILGHKIRDKHALRFAIAQANIIGAMRNLNTLLSIIEKGDKDKERSRLKLDEVISSIEVAAHILDELANP
ncbi:MAG: hypothetical protein HYZ49_03860 [Chloroflexi bacterium]|nr:hypothetical protein [Chloroflexota bacterium]